MLPFGLLLKLIPFLKNLNLDPSKWDKAGLEQAFVTAMPGVVQRLEADQMTITAKGGNDAAERIVLRACIYLLFKGALAELFPQLPKPILPYASDALRDRMAKKVVPRLMKTITPTTTTPALVTACANAIVEQIF